MMFFSCCAANIFLHNQKTFTLHQVTVILLAEAMSADVFPVVDSARMCVSVNHDHSLL